MKPGPFTFQGHFCANFNNSTCYDSTILEILLCFNDNCLAKKAYFRLIIILAPTIVPSFADTYCSLSPKLNKEETCQEK